MSKKENKEQIEKLINQINELEKDIKKQKEHVIINFDYDVTKDNKLIITFKGKHLSNSFSYDEYNYDYLFGFGQVNNGFIKALKKISENFNGIEINFENCVIEQKMFDKIISKNNNTIEIKTLEYDTDDNKKININFNNIGLQNVDLTDFTTDDLESLKDQGILSENINDTIRSYRNRY